MKDAGEGVTYASSNSITSGTITARIQERVDSDEIRTDSRTSEFHIADGGTKAASSEVLLNI